MADPCFNDNHGIDPLSDEVKAIFDGETMPDGSVFSIEAHLEKYGELLQPLYVSSPTEDVRGAIWLKFSDYTCPRNPDSDFDFSGYGCITDVLVRIHDPFGKLSHFIVRKHSESFIIKACELGEDGLPVFEDETDEDTCGLFILPGRLTDYGVAHAQYKQVACHLPGEPGGLYPDDKIDQPPYRATSANGSQYWVATSPNPIVSAFYDNVNEFPDNFAWNSVDPFFAWPQLGRGDPDVSMCGIDRNFADVQAELDSAGVLIPGNEHKIFQLVDLRLGPIPGVGTFWYDVFGNQLPPGMCTDANSICVPYTFSEGFPAFAAINYDATDRNDCDLIPCFIADDGGLELLPPDDGLVH
jgi:hypothetical protein